MAVCSDSFIAWMEHNYNGIYRGKDHYNDWLVYAARQCHPDNVPLQQALKWMLIIACNPLSIDKTWRSQLKQHGWRSSQVKAMPAFAAFHAARIVAEWQAAALRASKPQADDDALWAGAVPAEELW